MAGAPLATNQWLLLLLLSQLVCFLSRWPANAELADFATTLQQQQHQQQQQQQQLLQVFAGGYLNDTPAASGHWNHFKLMERQGDFLLLGARNVVYNLSLSSLREQRRLEWPSSEDDVKMCRVKGKSAEQCQNYIRVLKLKGPDTVLVCGTNAYKPRCRTYLITPNSYELETELPGEGFCPYQENQNVTSLFTDGQLYSATATQFSGIDGLIHRAPLRTEQFNPKQLNSPNFVSSFRHGHYVYFLFRETAIEHLNCGKTVYSRIARVCTNDSGGPSRASRSIFTSFTKARLNCSIPGEFPFYFDEIQAATGVLDSGTALGELLYAVFTTPANSIGGSAVCAFRMADILAAFEGPFKGQPEGPHSNWLPVPESRVPVPRPGTCVNDSRQLADESISFIKENPLMEQAVEAVWSQPLIMMASINFRFTQIAVDAQVESQRAPGAHQMRADVIFVATNDGRVFKLINTHHMAAAAGGSLSQQAQALTSSSQRGETGTTALPDVSASALVIEELHLFDAHTPINNLMIVGPQPQSSGHSVNYEQPGAAAAAKLLVLSANQLKAISVSRCERALTCQDCLALLDPYCVWDMLHMACRSVGRSHPPEPSTTTTSTNNNNNKQHWLLHQPPNNFTYAWWHQCPEASLQQQQQQPQVGQPFRSLFSSHLQVPSRYDYASGHHLSSLGAHPFLKLASPSANLQQQAPASECLTFCGGSGATQTGSLPAAPQMAHDVAASNCADLLVHKQYIGTTAQQLASGNLYTSENLYFAVIVCALLALILGLVFGFAMGRQAKRHDASVCSSTFDETNLYMASTGSGHPSQQAHHHSNLFAAGPPHQRLLQHPAAAAHLLTGAGPPPASGAGSSSSSANQLRLTNGQLFDAASQCLLYESNQPQVQASYGNHQQMLLQLAGAPQHQHQLPLPPTASQQQRMGALPPLPATHASSTLDSSTGGSLSASHQGPLINTTTGKQISRSQLTPSSNSTTPNNNNNNLSSASGGANTNSTATIDDHQLYLNQPQLHQLAHQQHPSPQPPNNNNNHQKSSSVNGSLIKGSTGGSSKNHSSSSFQQQQQQQQLQLHQHHLQNNKIYL